MRSRLWLNLALLVLAVAIGWFALGTGTDTSGDASPRLLEIDKQSVSRIRIAVSGNTPIDLQRRSDRWQMLSPYRIPADRARIDLLLDFLDARSLGTFPASPQDLSSYGLDHPGFSIDIDQHHFDFGAQHPFKPARYLRYDGTVHMVADLVTQHALAGATAYVDTLLIPEGTRIERISVPGFEAEQRGNQLHASVATASADAIARFIEDWRAARATSVQAETSSGAADGIVQIVADDGTTIGYRIVARKPAWLLRRDDTPLVFELAEDTARSLFERPPGTPPP